MKLVRRSLIICCMAICAIILACSFEDDEIPPQPVRLVEIAVDNMNFENEKAFISDDPIRKEAYIIGMTYMVEDEVAEGNQAELRKFSDSDKFVEEFELKILCNNDFDAEHPAGSDVTDMFYIRRLYRNYQDTHDWSLILHKTPDEGEHSFTVQAIFDDKIIEAQTNLVRLY